MRKISGDFKIRGFLIGFLGISCVGLYWGCGGGLLGGGAGGDPTPSNSVTPTPSTSVTPTPSPTSTAAVHITSWHFVDGNGSSGLYRSVAANASAPMAASINGKLYVGFLEAVSAVNQFRVVVYNGNDASPGWAFVDGNSATAGLNLNSSRSVEGGVLAAFNGKLYAMWLESDGSIFHVRAAVYNGNDSSPSWAFIDGGAAPGLNHDPTHTTGGGSTPPALGVHNSKLYATWTESNGSFMNVRVAVYNGNDSSPSWSFVDGNGANGINKVAANGAQYCKLVSFNSKLYAVWKEYSGVAGANQIRAAVYNGNDGSPGWTFVDGNGSYGLNRNETRSALLPNAIVFDSKLYLTWQETNGSHWQVRVSVYNGNDSAPSWSASNGDIVASGLNQDTSKDADAPVLSVVDSKLYLVWSESNGTAYQVRAKLYDYAGSDSSATWTSVDGNGTNGINKSSSNNAFLPILFNFENRGYALWKESGIRVAVGQ